MGKNVSLAEKPQTVFGLGAVPADTFLARLFLGELLLSSAAAASPDGPIVAGAKKETSQGIRQYRYSQTRQNRLNYSLRAARFKFHALHFSSSVRSGDCDDLKYNNTSHHNQSKQLDAKCMVPIRILTFTLFLPKRGV